MVLEVIVGPMFAGKSEELIKNIRKYFIAHKKVQVFKHGFDSRYSKESISSHNHAKIEAFIAMNTQDIINELKPDTEIIAIDEVQFFDDAVIRLCNDLADRGKHVIVSGLGLNFYGEPFKFADSERTMAELMVLADKITSLTAVCTHKELGNICGMPATRTQRMVDDRDPDIVSQVLVGGSESYEARCRVHHKKRTGQKQLTKNFSTKSNKNI
jgi:thymidine kinase